MLGPTPGVGDSEGLGCDLRFCISIFLGAWKLLDWGRFENYDFKLFVYELFFESWLKTSSHRAYSESDSSASPGIKCN